MKKALLFCSLGLGDGLLFLIIAKNLFDHGYEVDIYHPFLFEINQWFNYANIKPYPGNEDFDFLKAYDLIIINSDYNPLNKAILRFSKKNYPKKTYELHPSTCKARTYLGDLKFNSKKPIIYSLAFFCKNFLKLKNVKLSNGINISDLEYRKFSKRIIIHPTSKDIEKNWPKEKYKNLCDMLIKDGYEPNLVLMDSEMKYFEDFKNAKKPKFKNLKEMSSFIYESGYMIGNDSGIAHLASNLKIPTLTIFSTKRKERFWKPSFYLGLTIVSWPLINIKGLRLREKYWKKTISIKRVYKKFKELVKYQEKYESSNI